MLKFLYYEKKDIEVEKKRLRAFSSRLREKKNYASPFLNFKKCDLN